MARKKDQSLNKVPPAPDHLGPIGRDHWTALFSSLVQMKLATELDKPVIEMACAMYEQFRNAESDKDRQSSIASYLRIMAKYGATPKDRKIMKLASPKNSTARNVDRDLEKDLGL